MKRLFIPTKRTFGKVDFSEVEKIKETKLALCYSIQFEELGKRVESILGSKISQRTQVLGCSSPIFEKGVEAIILIGEGKFHSVSLAYETGLPVYLFNESGLIPVSKEDVGKMERHEKGAYLKYLHSEKVGIIISTKPGQQRMKRGVKLKERIKDKKSYLFVSNEINVGEFENFGLDSWVNSACPRMDLDTGSVINISLVEKNL